MHRSDCSLPRLAAPAAGSAPPRNATSLVVVDDSGDATHMASVTIRRPTPSSETYLRDARTILDGFQVIPAV